MPTTINWQSPNGTILSFGVYQHSGDWTDVSGIYMFCRQESNGSYTPLYIGQASSLKDRLPLHEQWIPAVQKGASTVHAAVVPLQDDRDLFEKQLIQQFQPLLNQQHKGIINALLNS